MKITGLAYQTNQVLPFAGLPPMQLNGEEKYRKLIENAFNSFFLSNAAGQIIETNHIALSMFGYSRDELLKLKTKDLLLQPEENPVPITGQDTDYFPATGIRKNGEKFPIELSSVIFKDKDGHTLTSLMVHDVSEYRKAVRKHLTRLQLLQDAEELSQVGSWSWDFNNNTLECSDEIYRILGYTPGEIIFDKDSILERILPADREKLPGLVIEFMEAGNNFSHEINIIRKNNDLCTVLLKIRTRRTASGEMEKLIGTVQDISIKPDFAPSYESITEGFFTMDNNWTVKFWNKEAEQITGIRKKDIIGYSIWYFSKNLGNMQLFEAMRKSKHENLYYRFEDYYEPGNIWIEVQLFPSQSGLYVFLKNITSVKKAEAIMKLNSERYDLVVKATNDLVWDWDIIKDEIYRNSTGVERVYGHKNNDNIRTNLQWSDFIHPEDKARMDQQIAYYISSDSETSFSFNYRFRRDDGGYNYINDRGYIIRNELGIVIRMIGAARDVTDQMLAARNIEESEQRYKYFVQQSTEGIWRIELDEAMPVDIPVSEMVNYCMINAYIAECNDAFANMYGFESAEKIIGLPLNKMMPASNPVYMGYLYKFFTNNFNVEDEPSYAYDLEGNKLTFINNMLGVIEKGRLKRAWGTQRNITRQKIAEEQLQASEEQYKNLFNNNPSCIFIWDDEDFRILEVNQSAVDLYGYSKEEFKKMTVLNIRPEDEHENFKEIVEATRHNDNYRKTRIWKHITKQGETLFMEIASHNIIYDGKKRILAIGNNVTEKIALENSLNEERQLKQKQITDAVLTAQEKERQEMGEELHDNINQLLASTRLYIDCVLADETKRQELLEKSKSHLDTAMAEIRKLSKTLLPPSLGEVSLIESLTDLAQNFNQVNSINIITDWNGFDETMLDHKLKLGIFRIVQEQLNNILKHARAGNVLISLKQHGQIVFLSIKDDGIGFNTAEKRSGVGLRNITSRAEVNNGLVQINSSPGNGCELIVHFQV